MDGRAVSVSWFGGYGGSSDWRQKRCFLSPMVSASGFPCCQPRLYDAFEEGTNRRVCRYLGLCE